MRGRGAVSAVGVLVLGCALGGCGDPGASNPDDGNTDAGAARWTSTDPVATGPLVWEADGVVHLADDTEIDLGGLPSSYVVAGDGVYFVLATDQTEAETSSEVSSEVQFAAPDEGPVGTGLVVQADTLRASPDGRYLAGVDVDSGEKDDYGTPLAQVVVIDLQAGREVVRSSEGLGDLGDDLADLYEDAPVAIVAMSEETAYVDGANGTFALDLATGDTEDADGAELPQPGSPDSPDGAWTLQNSDDVRGKIVATGGGPVPLEVDAPQWTFDWWADATTVVGVAIAGDGSSSLLTCAVPAGTCAVLDESAGQMVRFANGATYPDVVKLLGSDR